MGVDERHVAASDECASGASPADIDDVIHCTQGPHYFLPTTACVSQNRLGLAKGLIDSEREPRAVSIALLFSVALSLFKTENK